MHRLRGAQLVALGTRGDAEGKAFSCQDADGCLVDSCLDLIPHTVGAFVDHLLMHERLAWTEGSKQQYEQM